MGSFNIQKIEKLKARKNVKGLIKALGYPEDLRVRTKAAEALGQINDKRAVEPLIAAFKDKIHDVRDAAVEALGKIGAPAVEPLIAALSDKDSDTRKYNAKALGEIGDARAVEPLINAMKKSDITVRKFAAEALVKIGASAVKPLIAVLRDEVWYVSEAAAEALGEIGDARAVESLIEALRDKDRQVREAAAKALGKISDAQAVGPLIETLRDKERTVRSAVTEALVKIGAPSLKSLIAVLRDEDWHVREAAAAGLNQIGWQPDKGIDGAAYWVARHDWDRCIKISAFAVEPLIAALRDEDWHVRAAVTDALGKIGAPAVEPLIAALRDNDRHVREAAAKTLGEIGDARAVEPLMTALINRDISPVRTAAVEALGKIGDARAVESLITVLRDNDTFVRESAPEALGKIGDVRAVEPLITVLRDKDSDMREAAAMALEKIGEPAVEPLIAVLWRDHVVNTLINIGAPAVELLIARLKEKSQDDDHIRMNAAYALGMIGDSRAVNPLIIELGDKNMNVRKVAAEALGNLGNALAERSLFEAFRDDKNTWEVRIAAAEGLDKLGWHPDKEGDNAAFWVGRHDWDRCVKIGAPAVEPLIAVLRGETSYMANAAEALGKIGDTRAVEPLITVLRDKDSDMREAAADGLDKLGWHPDKGIDGAAYWIARHDWDRCVKIGPPAVELLIAFLRCDDWYVNCSAEALGKIGDARAVEPLIAVLEKGNVAPYVRRSVARSLVLLYTSGKLDDHQKDTILALRSPIVGTSQYHEDQKYSCDHSDTRADIVEFPL